MPRRAAVRIITDSAARIPADWAAAHNVTIVPHYVQFNGKLLREDVDISAAELAEHALHGAVFSARPPTQEDFTPHYRKLADQKADVIALHVSSAMSAALRHSAAAKDDVCGRCNVHLIDTQTIGMGLHQLVLSAVAMSEQGLPAELIVKRLRGTMQNVYGLFISDDTTFLKASGRLRPAQAYLGKMLGVIPCLSMDEGNLVAVEKVRSPDRAIEKLSEFAGEFEGDATYAMVQLSPTANERTAALTNALAENIGRVPKMQLLTAGAVVGSIIGNTGLGIMIVEKATETA